MIKRSENLPYETPTIIVCPEPRFKPSRSWKYNLNDPARDFFTPWNPSVIPFIKDTFQNRTVEDLYEELSYSKNDLMFLYGSTLLKLGINEVDIWGSKIVIELKNLPTFYNGQCYLIELINANQWYEGEAVIYFGYRFEISHLNEYMFVWSRSYFCCALLLSLAYICCVLYCRHQKYSGRLRYENKNKFKWPLLTGYQLGCF